MLKPLKGAESFKAAFSANVALNFIFFIAFNAMVQFKVMFKNQGKFCLDITVFAVIGFNVDIFTIKTLKW